MFTYVCTNDIIVFIRTETVCIIPFNCHFVSNLMKRGIYVTRG